MPAVPNPADAGSGAVVAAPFPEAPVVPISPWGQGQPQVGDRVFRRLAQASGALMVALIAAIGGFLLLRAIPALERNRENFFTYGGAWVTTDTSAMHFGMLDLLQVTILVALFALFLAMPVALGVALFITQYAPRPLAGPLAYAVDLLAAVPSIIYGVWGLQVLAPRLRPIASWLNHALGWCFLFAGGNTPATGGGTVFTGGLVLAVMILPITTAVTREVFVQTPIDQIEAALALGATRWEVVRTTVLPFGKSGYVSGAMLGLGRALGETMALLIILRGARAAFGWSLFDGGSTFATKIAGAASDLDDPYRAGAYIAAGLVLFVLTFLVDALARGAVAGIGRRRSGR
ncbi:phosphate ABC transporter permease subunit PstC [Mycobacterium helveticum]